MSQIGFVQRRICELQETGRIVKYRLEGNGLIVDEVLYDNVNAMTGVWGVDAVDLFQPHATCYEYDPKTAMNVETWVYSLDEEQLKGVEDAIKIDAEQQRRWDEEKQQREIGRELYGMKIQIGDIETVEDDGRPFEQVYITVIDDKFNVYLFLNNHHTLEHFCDGDWYLDMCDMYDKPTMQRVTGSFFQVEMDDRRKKAFQLAHSARPLF